jgi:uncharacterized protein
MFTDNRQPVLAADTAAVSIDAGLRAFMLTVYNYMAAGLVLTGGVAWFVAQSPMLMHAVHGTLLQWVFLLAPLAIVMWMSAAARTLSPAALKTLFFVYAAMLGAWLSVLFAIYTGGSLARAFFISGGLFAGMSLYGYTTHRDLTSVGSFCVMGLWGIILASIVNIFLQSTMVQFVVSWIAIVVFIGLTAWDTQRTKELYGSITTAEDGERAAIMSALSLYLDLVNLFLSVLRIVGTRN